MQIIISTCNQYKIIKLVLYFSHTKSSKLSMHFIYSTFQWNKHTASAQKPLYNTALIQNKVITSSCGIYNACMFIVQYV